MTNRRNLLQQVALGVVGFGVLSLILPNRAVASDAKTRVAEKGCIPNLTQTERNKQILIDHYEAVQRSSLPPTLPGETREALSYGESTSTFVTMYEPPRGVAGWHAQSMGPSLCSYGPMIAEGPFVVEEWESFFYGKDGTMYSNQYCWIKEIQDDKVIKTHEYVDSHHVYTVFSPYAKASEGKPSAPTPSPRRRGPANRSEADLPPLKELICRR